MRNPKEYEEFAYYLAKDVYFRMRLSKGTEAPIKSVLNYMKAVIGFRKMSFFAETFSEIIDPVHHKGFNEDAATEKQYRRIEAQSKDIIRCFVESIINGIPMAIKQYIPKSITDKEIRSKLYTSAVLTLLNRFSNIDKYRARIRYARHTQTAYDYYSVCVSDTTVLLIGLDKSMEDTVRVIINKTLREFKIDIEECLQEFTVSKELYDAVNRIELEEEDKVSAEFE